MKQEKQGLFDLNHAGHWGSFLKGLIVGYVPSQIIMYLMMSFVMMDADLFSWGSGFRIGLIILPVLVAIFVGFINAMNYRENDD